MDAAANLRNVPPVPKLQPMDADIQAVADMILKAKNPVVVTDSVGREPEAFAPWSRSAI